MTKQTMTIGQIKELLKASSLDENILDQLRGDSRIGVQKLLASYEKAQLRHQALIEAHHQRLIFERKLWQEGHTCIAGIDEVGRGPLAGPVVAAAVILPQNTQALIGINDSKTLSVDKRQEYAQIIKDQAIAYSIAEIGSKIIDKDNIFVATQETMLESVKLLSIKPSYLLIDAMKISAKIPQKSLVKGDQRSLSIAAASILAKVHRDQLMVEYGQSYPEFGFASNAGYGTKEHLLALGKYGYTPIHRRSFAPIKNMSQKYVRR